MMAVSQLIWDKERDVIVSWCQDSLLQLQPGTFRRFQPEQLVVLIRVLAVATDQDDSVVVLNQDGAAGLLWQLWTQVPALGEVSETKKLNSDQDGAAAESAGNHHDTFRLICGRIVPVDDGARVTEGRDHLLGSLRPAITGSVVQESFSVSSAVASDGQQC